ncbi:hypothetical protein ABZ897_49605 [Nonomuraea sp. NPDC046802]|uniref:hypothetical protein n=1 Tax=Nonomuraea sp. NPDC046802 TaxID=3154919 RepID=UPI0033F056E9
MKLGMVKGADGKYVAGTVKVSKKMPILIPDAQGLLDISPGEALRVVGNAQGVLAARPAEDER